MNSTIVSVRVETKVEKFERLRDEWVGDAVAYLYKKSVFVPGEPGAEVNALDVASVVFDSLVEYGKASSASFNFDLHDPASAIEEELSYWN